MKLNVLERIILMGLLPKEENYLTFKIIMTLKGDLSFSEAEHKKIMFTTLPDGRVSWKNGAIAKDIKIPDVILSMIKAKLEDLEKEKKINDDNFSLYEKFIIKNS